MMKQKALLKPKQNVVRSIQCLETDKAALRAIAQMAVNVELFTIPLYMTTMYSIKGMHQVNIEDFDYYQGRIWPGLAPTVLSDDESKDENVKVNEKAFNAIFGVFIQEMFHVELASNLASAIGVRPSFTGSPLQGSDNSWICYGEGKTVIPGIVDLKDTVNCCDIQVKLGPLDSNSINLFCAIEQDDQDARGSIRSDKRGRYFPETPFKGWEQGDDLPMFGSIGHMYKCYEEYASFKYDDNEGGEGGLTLFERIYEEELKKWQALGKNGVLQRKMFNNPNSKAPKQYHEYPGVVTSFNGKEPEDAFKPENIVRPESAFKQLVK